MRPYKENSLHNKVRRIIALLTLILAGEAIFFLPFVLARIFRPTLLLVFDVSNTQVGVWFSAYGFVALISYFFGGPLADRFQVRNLMAIALWLTALGGFAMSFFPGNAVMTVIYAFWGFTTIFLFWAALIRATREWGGKDFQGRAFGWLEGGRGFTAAVIGTVSLFLFSSLMVDQSVASQSVQRIAAYKQVILVTSGIVVLSGILILLFVPKSQAKLNDIKPQHHAENIKKLIAKPVVWLLSITILCAYVGYKITDVFSLYANEILGFDEVKAAGVGTAALWMRGFVAILAGIFADRFSANRIISIGFALAVTGGLLIVFGVVNQVVFLALINLVFIMIGVYSLRALYFALISEANLSLVYTGTIVGIISVLGYTPDIFMSPLMGFLLDSNPGITGHQHVFLVLAVSSVVGLLVSVLFNQLKEKKIENQMVQADA